MSELTRSILKQYWGYPAFRPLQEDIVDSVVNGQDTLALLPTGGGKSICFQVPALAMEGICIVVTPLIALMKDQVAHLVDRGITAAAIYTGLHPDKVALIYNQAVFGRLKFLYVSPERLRTEQFLEAVKRMKVNLLAVDESHCISQWGYDFRPPYLQIAELRPYIPNTPVLALTATATAKVVDDIQFRLGFKRKNVYQSSFERPNVTYNVYHEPDKFGVLYRKLLNLKEGSAIVYVRNRKKTQVISDWLNSVGIPATFYHAGLEAKVRDQRQDMWMRGQVKVIACTNAFGMGIDKPDVRLVIHMDLPDSVEAYFQEAGRAGRDLKPSEAFLLVSDADIIQLHDNLQQSFPNLERIKQIYKALGNFLSIPVGAGAGVRYLFNLQDFAKRYNFTPLEVFNTLKLFEKEGILMRSESFDEPSKVWIKANREDLYRFQMAYPQLDAFIKCMLRSFPGIMSDFVPVNEESVARKIQTTTDQVVSFLKLLENYNFLSYEPRIDQPHLFMLSEYIDDSHFFLSKENYLDRKVDAQERIQAMIDFVTNNQECRSIQLLRYFNEKTDKSCGRCDVCLQHQRESLKTTEYQQISSKLLTTLREHPVTVYEAALSCPDYSEEIVIETIQWMIDNDMISKDESNTLKTNEG